MPTTLIVHLDIQPEDFARFVDAVRAHGKRSVDLEEGCIDFQVHLPRDTPGRVILVECYRDDDALDAHLASSHMADYLELTAPMVAARHRTVCDY